MGQRADALEREIVATREHMSRTIELMERQLRRTVDWQTKIRHNPWPYALAALGIGFVLAGGPRRTFATLGKLRPRQKTRMEKLLEGLPEPIAALVSPPVTDRLADLGELPKEVRKRLQDFEKERERQAQREDEERLRRVARATAFERIAIRVAEAAGTAVAGLVVKQLMERFEPKEE